MSLTCLIALLASLVMSEPIIKGQALPDFTLRAHQGERLSLSDLELSWVVLLFLDGEHSEASAQLAKSLQRNHYEFKDAGVKVVAITQQSPGANKTWAQQYALTFPILSDPENTVAKRYFPAEKRACCTVLLIDPMGLLAEHTQVDVGKDIGESMLKLIHTRTRTIEISTRPGQ